MSLLWVTAAYYHSTDTEFEPGDLVRPPVETGAENWADRLYRRTGIDYYQEKADEIRQNGTDALGRYSREHVYHADRPAREFGRHTYEVEPLTPVEPDPEDPGGDRRSLGWTRNQGPARVIRRV